MDALQNKSHFKVEIDELIRTRRRSVGLTITQDARLIVRAPLRTPAHEIERMIATKARWINQKRELFRRRISELPPKISIAERAIFKKKALAYLSQRVRHFASIASLSYKSVKVNEAKTRWGSCNSNGSINFTWRLILAPARVIDYVVIHELMHLKQSNHSFRFWNEVANLVPDYHIDEAWLKTNGHKLRC